MCGRFDLRQSPTKLQDFFASFWCRSFPAVSILHRLKRSFLSSPEIAAGNASSDRRDISPRISKGAH